MYVAYDINGKRLYADDEARYQECFCPACGELLVHRKGKVKKPHFAHRQGSDCFMGLNKDYMTEWHIRMQSYFPKEQREFRFKDLRTGEIHIADVYDHVSNTVIEFQHSPIKEEEYLSRTKFHLDNGRRIVWIFDESHEKGKDGYHSRLKPDDLCTPRWRFQGISVEWIYRERTFKWLYTPRKFLSSGPNLKSFGDKYSVCIYTGETDQVHRIISEDFNYEYVILSVGDITMTQNMSPDLFFTSERILLSQSPWAERIKDRAEEIERSKANTYESQTMIRDLFRTRERVLKGLSTDLSRCPLCGCKLEVKTAKKGRYAGVKFYGCTNYPKCDYIEDY